MLNPVYDATVGLRLWTDMVRIGLESQFVVGMRLAGMMGLMPHAAAENARMVTEKSDAACEAIGAALAQVSRGARLDQIMAAALKPYGQRTRANALRLYKAC